MSLRHRHAYAADLRRGLPGRRHENDRGVARHQLRARAAAQPRSARFELVGIIEGVQTLVSHVRLSILLAAPEPSGGA